MMTLLLMALSSCLFLFFAIEVLVFLLFVFEDEVCLLRDKDEDGTLSVAPPRIVETLSFWGRRRLGLTVLILVLLLLLKE